ncbi:MAG TPA: MMPL family transporter, partial [Candidatus Bathyarchaeia archaeon]|nr:MMPL family transporter [Candidatus Bathyarchaeia archaeon]
MSAFSLIALLLARRRAALLVLAVLTGFLGWSALTLRIDPGVETMIPSGPGDLDRLRAFQARFGADEVVVLALHGDGLFTRESLDRLDRLTRQVAALPHVASVLSPTNVRDLEGDALGPVPVVPYALVRAGRLAPATLGARLGAHPIFGGLLVARDARTAAILVELEPAAGATDSRRGLVADLRRLAGGAGPGVEAYVGGIPVEKVDVAAYIARDQMIFVPLIFFILAVMTAALYRHAVGMLVPVAVVTTALVWTLGLFGLAGGALNPVTSLMTPVILVMSLEGTIQLVNQYLAGRAAGLDRPAALARAHTMMRLPCLNAALTAAIGFVSLLTLPVPAIRDFGLFTAIGIMLGYGLTIVLTPLLLASLPDVPARVIAAFEPGPVERGLARLVRGVGRHRGATALAVSLVLAGSALGVARLRVETDLIGSLRHASPLAAATRFIDAHLSGVNSVEILVSGLSARDPERLNRIARFEDALRSLPHVRKVTGLTDLLARVNRAMHRGDDGYARLPDGPEAADDLADYLEALGTEAPAELRRFLAAGADRQATLRIIAWVPALDSATSQALFARIRDAARGLEIGDLTLTGNFVVFSNMSTTLVRHQIQGLAVALVLILAVMALQFRSLRLGLVCVIPNVAPVLMVYGLMGWSGIALSVPTAMIACVTIGTIVDNSIYLLARFREAFARQADYVEALTAMVNASGRAVVFSTVTLAAGFWVGVFSSFVPTVHFAVLTGAAFLLGLISQFVLLPLVLVVFQPLGRPVERAAGLSGAPPTVAALAVGLALVFSGGVARGQDGARDVMLKDQFGKTDGVGRHHGQVVLLVYGKVDGMRRMKAWEEQAREKGSSVVVLRGLDVREVRGQKTEVEVSERLQQRVPSDIAILIDWNGDFPRVYGLPDAEVSVT